MAEDDRPVDKREIEALEINSEEEALLHFGRYSETRAAVPWEQRTFKERMLYHIDRIFLSLLALFLLVVFGEFMYKIWYVTNCRKILEFILESVSSLFTQEKDEELIEL